MPPIKKLNTERISEHIGTERRKEAYTKQEDIKDINSLEKEIKGFPKMVLDWGLLIEEIDYSFRTGNEKISMNQVQQSVKDEEFSTKMEMSGELSETEVLGYLAEIGITNIGITKDLDGSDVGLIAIPKKLSGKNIPMESVLKALSSSLVGSEDCEIINSKYLELLSKSDKFGNTVEDAIEIVMKGVPPESVHREKANFFIYQKESVNKDEMDTYIVGIAPFDFLQNSGLGEKSIIKQYLEHPNWTEG